MKEKLLEKFEEIFGSSAGARVYFAPGRVNLIGEHTDYNGAYKIAWEENWRRKRCCLKILKN